MDGYKRPPDLHGTGSEQTLYQAWNKFVKTFIRDTGSSQTGPVFQLENPLRLECEIHVATKHGHGMLPCKAVSSVEYWSADQPYPARDMPPVSKQIPVYRSNQGIWLYNPDKPIPSRVIQRNEEMLAMKRRWRELN